MPIPGDLRSLDGRTRLDERFVGVEAETRMSDVQALTRRALLKKRDSSVAVLVLLVADTRANRAILVAHRESLRGSFPLDTREILTAISRGHATRRWDRNPVGPLPVGLWLP